jgi:hypothetical protein
MVFNFYSNSTTNFFLGRQHAALPCAPSSSATVSCKKPEHLRRSTILCSATDLDQQTCEQSTGAVLVCEFVHIRTLLLATAPDQGTRSNANTTRIPFLWRIFAQMESQYLTPSAQKQKLIQDVTH